MDTKSNHDFASDAAMGIGGVDNTSPRLSADEPVGEALFWLRNAYRSQPPHDQQRVESVIAEVVRLRSAVNARDDLVAALRPFKQIFERIGGEGRSADTTITFKAVEVAPLYSAAVTALRKAGAL